MNVHVENLENVSLAYLSNRKAKMQTILSQCDNERKSDPQMFSP